MFLYGQLNFEHSPCLHTTFRAWIPPLVRRNEIINAVLWPVPLPLTLPPIVRISFLTLSSGFIATMFFFISHCFFVSFWIEMIDTTNQIFDWNRYFILFLLFAWMVRYWNSAFHSETNFSQLLFYYINLAILILYSYYIILNYSNICIHYLKWF